MRSIIVVLFQTKCVHVVTLKYRMDSHCNYVLMHVFLGGNGGGGGGGGG